MTIQELRVGNLVSYKGETIEVVNINKGEINSKEWGHPLGTIGKQIGAVEPIAITEEWLERFGFSRWWTDCLGIEFAGGHSISFENGVCKLGYGSYCTDGSEIEIKYIHQLQNLYYALTSEELQIKEL